MESLLNELLTVIKKNSLDTNQIKNKHNLFHLKHLFLLNKMHKNTNVNVLCNMSYIIVWNNNVYWCDGTVYCGQSPPGAAQSDGLPVTTQL